MRVLFIIHEMALNGAVTALLLQVRRMRARGDRVTIVTPQLTGPAAALLPQFQETGAEITSVFTPQGHDVVVGCTIFAVGVLKTCVGQVPTAWWIHEGRAGLGMYVGNADFRDTLHRVGKLIFPGRGTVEGVWRPFLSRLPPGRIDVIPQFVPPPPEGEPAPKRPGRRLVVCVGTVYPRKRQVDLLRAVAMLANAPLDCALVGHMSALDAPGDEIIRSDPERFIVVGGQSPEAVHSWYRAADVFSLPSGDESMPIAPIEAAWHGLPIMLADLECYEGVWRHGANALIHPVGDAEMIAWYLNMVLQSAPIRNRLSKAARTVPLRFAEQRMGGLFDAALAETITTFQ